MSVRAMFQIISQLQNCSEVRIFLNPTNIGLSNTDCRFPARLVQEYLTHFRNASVKTLKITGSTAHGRTDCNQTRFHDILTYANTCFPKLEAVRICMENSGGNYWDKVQEFCSNKLHLPKHSVSLKNGKVTCDPDTSLVAASSSARAMNAQKSVPRAIAESPVSAQSVTSQITQLIKIKEEKIAPVSIKKEKDDVPLVDLIDSDEVSSIVEIML
ncbi:Flagellar hook-associated protein 3 [Orchesella cincta]|uniref:Flagellar hook-associated protein 3 n=1 Tax=Orchesella cincta TaxID=48709 RepID=A0A1D2N1I0_ORCCI|nr:Flagellar hook-associated protein 3 [Orchesella cincta]